MSIHKCYLQHPLHLQYHAWKKVLSSTNFHLYIKVILICPFIYTGVMEKKKKKQKCIPVIWDNLKLQLYINV